MAKPRFVRYGTDFPNVTKEKVLPNDTYCPNHPTNICLNYLKPKKDGSGYYFEYYCDICDKTVLIENAK